MAFVVRSTVTQTFLDRVQTDGDHPAYQFKPTNLEYGPPNHWKTFTFKEFYHECRLASFGLHSLGITKDDKIAILSNTRYEWSLCDMAILGTGGVTVPIYSSSITADVVYILNNSDAKIVFIEDAKQLEKILQARTDHPDCLPLLQKIILFEPSAMRFAASQAKDVMTLQALKELGRREESRDPLRFDETLSAIQPQDVLTICYTSGTTGIPKGVMITQENMMSVLSDTIQVIGPFIDAPKEVLLTFLPFSHIFGKVESMTPYAFGWLQVFAENLDQLMTNMAEIKPTIQLAVPRVFEKAYGRIHTVMDGESKFKKNLFRWAFDIGRKYYQAIWDKRVPSIAVSTQYATGKALVFGKISQRFGGRLRFAVCGGAPLAREIGEFFQILGIKILEGYGLTETCGPISVNLPDDTRFGTVGRPYPDVSIKIAEDGEILIQSRKVFKGYYKMPEETAEVLQDGWFKTGDIGYLDEDGFLHITDRKKDLIVTSGGKNVAPQKIENLARSRKPITQFVVHGDKRHYLTALVTLERDQVIQYANAHQILFSEYSELIKQPKILALVQKAIDDVNQHLAGFETIKKFLILPHDFTVDSGELTPSLKVKRNFVNQRYKAELDSLYAS